MEKLIIMFNETALTEDVKIDGKGLTAVNG